MSQAVPVSQAESIRLPEAAALVAPRPINPVRSPRRPSALNISLLTAAMVVSASLGFTTWRVASLPAFDTNAPLQAHDEAVAEAQSDSDTEPTKLAVLDGTPSNIISAAPVINASYAGDATPEAIPLAAQTTDAEAVNALTSGDTPPSVITAGDEVVAETHAQTDNDDAPPPVPQGADAVLMPPNS